MKNKNIAKRFLAVLLSVIFIFSMIGCGGSDDECSICGGSGYYQKKDCPGCP